MRTSIASKSHPAEDLAPLREVPVAERRRCHQRRSRPRPASQDSVALPEEDLGVLPVRTGAETRVAVELRRGPLPDSSGSVESLVPGRRPLPLRLGGKAGPLASCEGVGLEPGDMLDGCAEVTRRDSRPASSVRVVVALLPGPALLAPPGPVLVAAAFGEREEGRVGHGKALYREGASRYTVARQLVVVDERAVLLRAHLELAGLELDPLGFAVDRRQRLRLATRLAAEPQRLAHRL